MKRETVRPVTWLVVGLLAAATCSCHGTVVTTGEKATVAQDIHSTVMGYVRAGLKGDDKAATRLCVPGTGLDKQAKEFQEIRGSDKEGVDRLDLVEIRANQWNALAISTPLREKRLGSARLVFLLSRTWEGKWLLDDIDLEDPEGVKGEIARYMQGKGSGARTIVGGGFGK